MQLLLPALNRLRDVINYLLGVLIELRRVSRHRRMLRHLMLVTVMLRSNHRVNIVLRAVNHRHLRIVLQCLHNVLMIVVILSFLEVLKLHRIITILVLGPPLLILLLPLLLLAFFILHRPLPKVLEEKHVFVVLTVQGLHPTHRRLFHI